MGWVFSPPIFRDEKLFKMFESTNEAVSENRFFLEVESIMSVSEIMNFEQEKYCHQQRQPESDLF